MTRGNGGFPQRDVKRRRISPMHTLASNAFADAAGGPSSASGGDVHGSAAQQPSALPSDHTAVVLLSVSLVCGVELGVDGCHLTLQGH